MSPTKTPTLFTVPAGTVPARCKGPNCNALIFFVRNPKTGKMLPIDCDCDGGKRPSESKDVGQLDMLSGGEAAVYDGKGCLHFLTCSDADSFSKGNH